MAAPSPWDRQQFLEVEQWAENTYDLLGNIHVPSASMAGGRQSKSLRQSALRVDTQNVHSKKTCAGAAYDRCEDAVGIRSRKNCSRTEDSTRQSRKFVVVVFHVTETCSGQKTSPKKNSGAKGWVSIWARRR